MSPELYDPIEAADADRWFPEGNPARLLMVCIQACKDILKIGSSLSSQRPSTDRRGLTLLATPILSLMDNTIQLHKEIGREDRSYWDQRDVEALKSYGKKLRKDSEGPVRKLRNARSGHHDPGKLGPESAPRPTPEILLPPLAHALFVLTLAFNHKDAFQWYRVPDASKPDEFEYFLEVATRLRVVKDAKGLIHPREILGLVITRDPRHEAFVTVNEAIALYNRLVSDAGYPDKQIVTSPARSAPDTQERRIKLLKVTS